MITKEAEIQAKTVKRLLLRVYRRYQAGLISEDQATKEAQLLTTILRAIEVTDLEQRVDTLSMIMEGRL